MLIRFTVENYLSIRDRVELSMIAGPPPQAHPEHVVVSADPTVPQLLKAAILYGANASGKSNLVRAIAATRRMLLEPAEVHGKMPITPFKLDAESRRKPSRFEFEIRIGAHSFAYGFVATNEQVDEEWLYELGAKDRCIFERSGGQTRFDNIHFANPEEGQFLEFTAKGTRNNRLFLAECRERRVKENVPSAAALFEVIHWFENVLMLVFPDYTFGLLELSIAGDTAFKDALTGMLRGFDTGIDAVELQEKRIEDTQISADLRSSLEERVNDQESGLVGSSLKDRWLVDRDARGRLRARRMVFRHGAATDSPLFEPAEESDGTIRLLDLVPALLASAELGRVVVIDELDRSLHPGIAHSLLAEFLGRSHRESQLIVTTHETTLLKRDFLRRDEIWMVEKGKDQSTRLTGLEEFKGIPENGDLESDYLHGRYGGVPVLRDL